MLCQKRLADGWIALETPSLDMFPMTDYRGSVSDRSSNFMKLAIRHPHSLQPRFTEVTQRPGFSLSPFILVTFLLNKPVPHIQRPPEETVWKRPPWTIYSKDIAFFSTRMMAGSSPCLPLWPLRTTMNTFDFKCPHIKYYLAPKSSILVSLLIRQNVLIRYLKCFQIYWKGLELTDKQCAIVTQIAWSSLSAWFLKRSPK